MRLGGLPPLVRMLRGKEDKKVTLHSTAAVQNLTYKNTLCCQEVLEHGGEKALKKLLQVRGVTPRARSRPRHARTRARSREAT